MKVRGRRTCVKGEAATERRYAKVRGKEEVCKGRRYYGKEAYKGLGRWGRYEKEEV